MLYTFFYENFDVEMAVNKNTEAEADLLDLIYKRAYTLFIRTFCQWLGLKSFLTLPSPGFLKSICQGGGMVCPHRYFHNLRATEVKFGILTLWGTLYQKG